VIDAAAIADYLRRWGEPQAIEVATKLARLHKQSDGQEELSLELIEHKRTLPISPSLRETKAVLQAMVGASTDIIFRDLEMGSGKRPGLLVFMDNAVKKEYITAILDNLAVRLRKEPFPDEPQALARFLATRGVTSSEATPIKRMGDVTKAVLSGDAVLLADGTPVGIQASTKGWEHRLPEEPESEPVVRGPKEGFVETIAVNLALMRRRMQDERLRVETFTIGVRSETAVVMIYLSGLTFPDLVDEVRKRLKRIRIDSILESGYIEELIQDEPFTPFPLMKQTERPDVAASELMSGRVVLLTDGTPHALCLPATFAGEMQASEDYYQNWLMGSFIRLLRYVYLMVALLGPSVYVAITTFHQEMIPTRLLLSIMAAREGVPFPAVVEAILMELTFEALREAGVRLPRPVGQAISIVGALVIGDAVVRAGLVSPVMVVVVAITAISSFIIPTFSTTLAIRLLRFPMVLMAGTFGFYGIALGLLIISVHLATLRSFGVPYMSPSMPPTADDWKDMMIRAPWWLMRQRPRFMPVLDRQRQKKNAKPAPPQS
jgi:spore germination protein KA